MKLLLDTHALIWWMIDSPALGRAARAAIADDANEIIVSAVSALEVATKHRLGKLPQAERLARAFAQKIHDEGFTPLPVTIAHAATAGALKIPHKDPFDRLLIAQAQIEDLLLVSNEGLFDSFGANRLW